MSSGRQRSSGNRAKDALEQFKALKEKGLKRLDQYEVEDEGDIYEEVDDKQYSAILEKRLREDDFVVDDDGRGYVDYGVDDWEANEPYSDEESGDKHGATSRHKRKKKTETLDATQKTTIASAFMKASRTDKPVSHTSSLLSKPTTEGDLNLEALLEDLQQNPDIVPARAQPPSKPMMATATPFSIRRPTPSTDTAAPRWHVRLSDLRDKETVRVPSHDVSMEQEVTESQCVADMDLSYIHADMSLEAHPVKEDCHASTPMTTTEDRPRPPLVPASHPAAGPALTGVDWFSLMDREAVDPALDMKNTENTENNEHVSQLLSSPPTLLSSQPDETAGELSSMQMYWLDASVEQNGQLFVFGKTWHAASASYVSVCVSVRNVERNLFVLPRTHRLDDNNRETDQPVTMADVHEEIQQLMDRHRIGKWASKVVTRKYAFELPDVPRETSYLKVLYSHQFPALPRDALQGKTFKHIFGANTSPLELFLLKRALMGPCWLDLQSCTPSHPKVSWCKMEVTVEDPKEIRVSREQPPPPPLIAMSLSLKTVVNHEKHRHEIVLVSAIFHRGIQCDAPTPSLTEASSTVLSHFTAVRQLGALPFPVGFAEATAGTRMELCKTERSLLSYVLAHIHKMDPDVVVGHNITGFDLGLLLHQCKEHKVDHWSRLGRLKRTLYPTLAADPMVTARQMLSGRLICDTWLSAKELVKERTYSLTQLAASQLGIERKPLDLERIAEFFMATADLAYLARHCENDAYLALHLMLALMVLPLTKQLTNLAGNLWARTLLGSRAERNEYLLLHEFHKLKYLCPDKGGAPPLAAIHKKKPTKTEEAEEGGNEEGGEEETAAAAAVDDDDEEEEDGHHHGNGGRSARRGPRRRKPTYAGGLVLEPKTGFYDRYVLLLDFNSLYPSIIQEYNICFTTVDRSVEASQQTAARPSTEAEPGVLPRLLRTLVERRRQVKSLMTQQQQSNNSGHSLQQLELRQRALKLTANSMYGCLGFSMSRFYARPLAMMITALGRETLQRTVDIAQDKLQLEVIYGDTDSIMIHTHTDDLTEVRRIGQSVKREVNALYRKLEIEVDAIFQRMLLLKKKKYAALVVKEGVAMTTTLEIKGLDLVRRDWCRLSHDVSQYILEQIMSDQSRDDVIAAIHAHLEHVANEVRAGHVPLDAFVIDKNLMKAPEDYADARSQPQVQVALRMKARGVAVRAGDSIPYVICCEQQQITDSAAEQQQNKSYAMRAYHPDDVIKGSETGHALTLDVDWYLRQQVYPPVVRLCAPIEGMDAVTLAHRLGLDIRGSEGLGGEGGALGSAATMMPLMSQLSDAERFKEAERFSVVCGGCQGTQEVSVWTLMGRQGMQCVHCAHVHAVHAVCNQLAQMIRGCIQRYYDGYLVCDDPTCGQRSRRVHLSSMTAHGRRCPVSGCRGMVRYEYTDQALYTQLLYLQSLFDVERQLANQAAGGAEGTNKEEELVNAGEKERWRQRLLSYRPVCAKLKETVDAYMDRNASAFVDLKSLFSFVPVLKAVST